MAPFDLCVDVQPQLAFSQPASPTPEASHEQRAPVNEKGDGREGGQKLQLPTSLHDRADEKKNICSPRYLAQPSAKQRVVAFLCIVFPLIRYA